MLAVTYCCPRINLVFTVAVLFGSQYQRLYASTRGHNNWLRMWDYHLAIWHSSGCWPSKQTNRYSLNWVPRENWLLLQNRCREGYIWYPGNSQGDSCFMSRNKLCSLGMPGWCSWYEHATLDLRVYVVLNIKFLRNCDIIRKGLNITQR